MSDIKGQKTHITDISVRAKDGHKDDFVLEKNIFSNVFGKDIRRVFIYKKVERLAKAIHLVTPAFAHSPSLRNRIDSIAVGLVDAAILPPPLARDMLSRELLALSTVLSIARTGGFLSSMNADLIAHEAQTLLQEVAAYEEPRLFLDEAPTLPRLARDAAKRKPQTVMGAKTSARDATANASKGQNDGDPKKDKRRSSVLSVIKDKGQVSIKDISLVIRGVSEKTIQRELQALVEEGVLQKKGERRWSTYSLA